MTKTMKIICSVLVCALLTLTLASCSAQKKYEKMAEDIRVAVAKEEPLTYEEVSKKLGDPTINLSASFGDSGVTGWITWYDGCEDQDALDAKLEAGKEVAYIRVSFSGGKAVDAEAGVKAPAEE